MVVGARWTKQFSCRDHQAVPAVENSITYHSANPVLFACHKDILRRHDQSGRVEPYAVRVQLAALPAR